MFFTSENGGSCVDGMRSYTCKCPAGVTGENCQTDINECKAAVEPCTAPKVCSNTVGSYACTCPAGYTGSNCETDINECESNPCENTGMCVNNVNSFQCLCCGGWQGDTCNEWNPGENDPCSCKNAGRCLCGIDRTERFCKCLDGFTGSKCQTNVTEQAILQARANQAALKKKQEEEEQTRNIAIAAVFAVLGIIIGGLIVWFVMRRKRQADVPPRRMLKIDSVEDLAGQQESSNGAIMFHNPTYSKGMGMVNLGQDFDASA